VPLSQGASPSVRDDRQFSPEEEETDRLPSPSTPQQPVYTNGTSSYEYVDRSNGDRDEDVGAGIGNTMMLASPPASPVTKASSPTQRSFARVADPAFLRGTRNRPLSSSFPSLPSPGSLSSRQLDALSPSPSSASSGRTPKASEDTFPGPSTTSANNKGKGVGFLPKIAIEPGSPLDPDLVSRIGYSRQFSQKDAASGGPRTRPIRIPSQSVGSFDTDSSGEYVIPVTATEFGPDWPMELRRELEGLGQELDPQESSADDDRSRQPTRQSDRADSISEGQDAIVTRSRPPSEIPTPTPALMRSRTPSSASAADSGLLRRVTSSESLSSIGTTYTFSSHGAFPNLPSLSSNDVSPRSSVQSSSFGHSRQSRSTSLSAPLQLQLQQPATPTSTRPNGNPGVSAFVRRPDGTIGRPLINVTTAQGTISQRRKVPGSESGAYEAISPTEYYSRPSPPVSMSLSADVVRSAPPDNTELVIDELGRRPTPEPIRNKPGSAGGPTTQGASVFSAGSLPARLRALSQPGRRPTLPSFVTEGYPPQYPSELSPGQPSTYGDSSVLRKTSVPTPTFQHSVMPPSHPPTPSYGYSQPSQFQPVSSNERSASPSVQQGQPPNEVDTPSSAFFPRFGSLGVTTSLPPPPADVFQVVSNPLRRPFQLMRQIRTTIVSGGYLSRRLYIPQSMWTQSGVKLSAIESKVRMIELLLTGLEALEKSGGPLILASTSSQPSLFGMAGPESMGERMIKELDSFDGLLDGIQSTLAKKLGYIDNVNGKRSGQASFVPAWSRPRCVCVYSADCLAMIYRALLVHGARSFQDL
jgi:hypothetical protein